MTDSEFNPKISKDEALALARKYAAEEDEAAFEAGRNIRNGQYSRANLVVIFNGRDAPFGKSRNTATICDSDSDRTIWCRCSGCIGYHDYCPSGKIYDNRFP